MRGNALVTGAAGFAGSHLVRYLLAETDCAIAAHVRSLERAGAALPGKGAALPAPGPRLALRAAELTDASAVRVLIAESAPDYAFLLAGQPATARSWEIPEATFRANVLAQVTVLEALLIARPRPRVLVIGSADAYGLVRPGELPIRESQPFRPTNPYGVSKVAQELMGYAYFLSRELPVVRVRAFNHLGPGQGPDFVAPAIARQLARIEAGQSEPTLRLGNTSPRRDFTDVRDIVRAYALVLERGSPGEVYNVGSGVTRSIDDLVAAFLEVSGLAVNVVRDVERVRAVDVPEVRCDNSRLRAATGWQPLIAFQQTIRDVWLDWRERVAAERA